MTEEFEYSETDRSTWRYRTPPPRPKWFEKWLVQLAGLNRHGKPNLRLVWGGTAISDSAEGQQLKYATGIIMSDVKGYSYKDPDSGEMKFTVDATVIDPSIMVFPEIRQESLGHLRWIIEKWTSPEELKRQKRFVNTHDENGRVLRDRPRHGVYDCYFIVQTLERKYRAIDSAVQDYISQRWKYEQLPYEQQEDCRAYADADRASQSAKRKDELWAEAAKGNFDIKLPQDEREKREHYWATKEDYAKERERYANTVTFYITTPNGEVESVPPSI